MRKFATVIGLLVVGLTASAQFPPRALFPETDPNAFKITTQANLEEAMKRIARLKSELAATSDADERDFLLNAILELCQGQLNEGRNDSGVIVVERSNVHRQTPDLPIRWQGAFPAIEDEIRSLGEEGLTKYEATYGGRAASLLEQAAATNQRERIQDLNRRFGLTAAGIRAGLLLATMWWEEGEINQSARALERVLELQELLSAGQRATCSAWLGNCYHKLGERANLQRLMETTLRIREHEVDAGGSSVKLGELLAGLLQTTRDATLDTTDGLGVEWPGGNYTNTGLHESPSGYSEVAWTKNLPALSANPTWSRFMRYPTPIVPPYLPVFDGDMFYMNVGDKLVAYSLIDSGKDAPAWTCKPFDTFERTNWRTIEPDPGMILPVSVYRGTVFASLENPLSTTYHDPNPDPNFNLYSHYPKVRRALCAVDGASGRLKWKIGGLYEGDRDQQTNFLSAVVHEGTLYAIASRVPSMAEIFLYAINPDTGEIKWDLRLCYGQQETTMFGRPAREPHPSLPCIAAGRLYLTTNIGGVVCVELATRSINWISRYDYIPRPITKYIDTYYREVTWYNSPTIYTEHEGKSYILAAPTDSRKLFALDARTGQIIWDLNQENHLNGGRALVGARDGICYVAGDGGDSGGGGSLLHRIDISKGRVTKSLKVTPHGRGNILALVGRPSLAANRLLWPGQQYGNSYCMISEVDLDSFRVVNSETVSSSYAGQGYSVFAQHGVVFTTSGRDYSRGNAQLQARFSSGSLLAGARKDYAEHPQSAEAAVRYGLLTLRLGDRDEGMKALKKGFELADAPPGNPAVRDQAGRALVDYYLALADKALGARKHTEALGFVRDAREFATGRNQMTDCFVREEQALLGQGDANDIEAFYRDTIRSDPDFGMGENPEIPVGYYCRIRLAGSLEAGGKATEAVAWWQEIQESPPRYEWRGVPLRALAIEHIREAVRAHGREVYSTQEANARALVETGNPEALRKCLLLYPLSHASDTAALELAWEKRTAWAPREGSDLLRRAVDEYADRPRLSEINALLALCYRDAGERLRARLLATRVLREHPKGSLNVGGESLFFASILKPLTEGDAAESAKQALPQLPAQLSELWARKWDVSGFTRLPAQIVSQPEPRIYVGETNRAGNHIVSLDAATGNPAWDRQVNIAIMETYRTPRGVLFVQGNGFALYDDEGGLQWETPSGGTPQPVSLDGALLVYGTRSFNTGTRKNMVHITARDADSGSELWETELEGNSVHWIGQTAAGIVVVTLGDEVAMYRLEPEFGEVQAQRILDTQGRITVTPAVVEGQVLVADRDGKMHVLDLDKLTTVRTFETRVRYPTMLEPTKAGVLVVGMNNTAVFDIDKGAEVWGAAYGDNASVTAQVLLKDSIVIATRTPGAPGRIIGFNLADGKRAFSYDIPRANESDRVDLQRAAPFDGGLVVAFTDNRITNGRMNLWGFRLVALNADGTERFKWEHQVDGAALFTQLALIDNHIAFTCDSTTFCFGRRE
ncbi:MAG: PQQ-binding-like beta-propeller repeat protein [Planctomycetes bacterium]|nr:PQQ-binding-like beta-propeller repeat protein [Planctomycetota bacterium]